MIDYLKRNHLSLLIVLWLVASATMGSGASFGANSSSTITNPFIFQQGFSLAPAGSSGSGATVITKLMKGTCSLIPAAYLFPATSSVAVDCAVTGVISTDTVFAQFATSTTPSGPGWQVIQASASTTAGYITLRVSNLTGVAALIPGSIGSTTQYLIIR